MSIPRPLCSLCEHLPRMRGRKIRAFPPPFTGEVAKGRRGRGFLTQVLLATIGVAVLVTTQTHAAAAPVDFYKGKTVFVVIGYSPGGGYDLYARILSQHLGKHIPGNPTIVPQNMPGAG